jgi:molecular chaperone DnaK
MKEAEEAIRGRRLEPSRRKTEALGTAAQKLGEKMYAKQQEQAGGAEHQQGLAAERR